MVLVGRQHIMTVGTANGVTDQRQKMTTTTAENNKTLIMAEAGRVALFLFALCCYILIHQQLFQFYGAGCLAK